MRHVTDAERRARLAVRHALAPAFRLHTPEAVTRAMTVLHATDAATVHLSYWARGLAPQPAQLDHALYEQRSLVKQLAMRRTLFVFPRDLLPAALGSASARVAAVERTRLSKEVVNAGIATDGEKWLQRVSRQVLSTLAEHPAGLTALELRKRLTVLAVKGKTAAPSPASQVLTYLGAHGDVVRATNAAHWRTARPRLTLMRLWLGNDPEPVSAAHGYRELTKRWLYTFGPGAEEDIVWWLGATKAAVRTALTELAAVQVSLDNGTRGWLLPDDLEHVRDPGPWVALLPLLDCTTMGWKNRSFFLPGHERELFDAQGNAGTTAWVDGRVVGFWLQDSAGTVQVKLLERVSSQVRRVLQAEARRLTEWLAGTRLSVVRSPAMLRNLQER